MVIIPAQYKGKFDVCYTYACKSYPENGSNVTVIETPRAKHVIPGIFASPEAIAHIMTQAELARRSGVSLRSIQMYEQRHKDINKASVETVYRLAKVFSCVVEDLLEH